MTQDEKEERKRCEKMKEKMKPHCHCTNTLHHAVQKKGRECKEGSATSTLKGSFCRLQDIHVHVKKEEWEVIDRLVNDVKESKTYSRSFCMDISWRSKCARGMCEADPDCTRASLSHRSVFVFFFISFARKLVVESPMTVDLNLTVAAVTDADTSPCC